MGPESTGKSHLTMDLAHRLNADYVLEYARQYLKGRPGKYSLNDVNTIADEQWASECRLRKNSTKPFRLFDTNMDVIRIWQEYVFNTCELRILKRISEQTYDLYLLCYPDLEWVYDPLRELPDRDSRMRVFDIYYETILDSGVPFLVVKGRNEDRTDNALKFIREKTSLK